MSAALQQSVASRIRWDRPGARPLLRNVRIVRALMTGERMQDIADRFRLHVSRVSQIAVAYHAARRVDAGKARKAVV
jgi:NADH:ubiquinone oxidoreductase subunit E